MSDTIISEMIYVGADHRGFNLKEKLKVWLEEWEEEYQDLGGLRYDQEDDYPDIAIKLGEKVADDKGKGILICGSGIGAAIAANKVKGVRAGVCMSPRQAMSGRNDDDMNILCLSATLNSDEANQEIVKAFLTTIFGSDERFIRRINKIKQYEIKER